MPPPPLDNAETQDKELTAMGIGKKMRQNFVIGGYIALIAAIMSLATWVAVLVKENRVSEKEHKADLILQQAKFDRKTEIRDSAWNALLAKVIQEGERRADTAEARLQRTTELLNKRQ